MSSKNKFSRRSNSSQFQVNEFMIDGEVVRNSDVVFEKLKEYPPFIALLTSKAMDQIYDFVIGCKSNSIGIGDNRCISDNDNAGCSWVCGFMTNDNDCYWECEDKEAEVVREAVGGWRRYLPEHLTNASTDSGWFANKYRVKDVLVFSGRRGISYSEFVQHQVQQQPSTSFAFQGANSNDLTYHDHLQLMYTYAKSPGTDLGNLTTPWSAMILFVLVMIIRIGKLKFTIPYFSAIGRKLLPESKTAIATPTSTSTSTSTTTAKAPEPATATAPPRGRTYTDKEREDRIYKFGEYFHKLFYHSFISIYGIYYIYYCNQNWWTDPRTHIWNNWGYQRIDVGMIWYYLIQCAYNLDAFIYLLEMSFTIKWKYILLKSSSSSKNISPPKSSLSIKIPTIAWSPSVRGDFNEMLIHHVVTNMLIFLSSVFSLTRIGSMVFLIHDVSEIPIDLSKLSNFLKWKTCTTYCFVTMVMVWCMTRLYLLPFVAYQTLLHDSFEVLQFAGPPQNNQDVRLCVYKAYGSIFVVLLRMLIALHTVWFAMFVRMAITLFCKGEAHDYSEHREGEAYYDQNGHQVTVTGKTNMTTSSSSIRTKA